MRVLRSIHRRFAIGLAATLFACEPTSNFQSDKVDAAEFVDASTVTSDVRVDTIAELDSLNQACGGECGQFEACVDGACVPTFCPPEGPYGVMPGDTLTDVVVKDCDGNDIHIHELCGANAGFFNLLAGW